MEKLFFFYWLKLLAISFLVLVFVLKIVVLLWWRPRRIEEHFSKQGIRGPPYRFFIGNVKELVEMMLQASSQPMPFSHNILPRVLSFYHHWKKIYGTCSVFVNYLSSFLITCVDLMFLFRKANEQLRSNFCHLVGWWWHWWSCRDMFVFQCFFSFGYPMKEVLMWF